MAGWITVAGVRPYDGRYELNLDEEPFTVREWGWIKRHAGYLPVTLDEDKFTDPEMITVLAIIAIRRSGTIETGGFAEAWDRFADAPFGSVITLEPGDADEDGDADGPPAARSSLSSSINGASSRTSSDRSGPDQSPTGTPASATSVSVPQTLAS